MNLWLRLLFVFLRARFGAPMASALDVSRVPMIVLPNDLDVNLHVNNGRYLTLMDLGRLDIFVRGGLLKALRGTGWIAVLSAAKVRFRREMRLWTRFRIETRIVYWADTSFVVEHRCIVRHKGHESVATIALMRGGVYDRTARAFVPVARLFERMGVTESSPPASDEVRAFLDAEEALKQAL